MTIMLYKNQTGDKVMMQEDKMGLVLGIVILVCALGIGLGAYFFMQWK